MSDAVRRAGRWKECDRFVRAWGLLDGTRTPKRGSPSPSEAEAEREPEGVLLEVGANVGACTVELLLRTRARVIALEPSPLNLFYLTRSLKLLAARHPRLADRVVVLPVAAGAAEAQLPLYVERGNLGNTMVGDTAFTERCRRRDARCKAGLMRRLAANATVVPLDGLFPSGLGQTRLIKLDTQGSECAVLDGAARAIGRSPRVSAIATEVASGWLDAQCCGKRYLLHLLRSQRVQWLSWGADRPWKVSCTRLYTRTGGTCLAHPHASAGRGAGNLSQLRLGDARTEQLLSPHEAGRLRARMQQCRESREAAPLSRLD